MRELKIHDIITVLVDYRTSMLTEGDAEARKTNNLNAFLNNWVKFDGKNLTPDLQPNGPLAVSGNLQSQFRVESDMELRDQLTFRIAAYIVPGVGFIGGGAILKAQGRIHGLTTAASL